MAFGVAFLWHMHQPDYRDESGVMQMPWVFLHAVRSYRDMIWHVERHPDIRVTFNLTPSLLEQLRLYEEKGLAADATLRLFYKPAANLAHEERERVTALCRSLRLETMLPDIRGKELFGQASHTDAELESLQTLFLLGWCAEELRRHDPLVGALLKQGAPYGLRQKQTLLEQLLESLPALLPRYRRLAESGRIALSTTPYYHPILPLLLDMGEAAVANPRTRLPEGCFPLPEDAKRQVVMAKTLFEETFGFSPAGYWPAEGAVSDNALALFAEAGARWVATDEEILARSLGKEGNLPERYRPHRRNGVAIAFRDRRLSDALGFRYRHLPASEAMDDFLRNVRAAAQEAPGGSAFVILDGENAWEFFPDNAYDLFESLYGALERADDLRAVTMEEAINADCPALPELSPGSWIYGTFDTWVAHPQKRRAWELLFQPRAAWELAETRHDPDKAKAAEGHFLKAECSDWYWWYGDDHDTDFADAFDTLFRGHLLGVYDLMGLTPPEALLRPIHRPRETVTLTPPVAPVANPWHTPPFFAWTGAGEMRERARGTMDSVRGPVQALRWGWDEKELFFRLEGAVTSRTTLRLRLDGTPWQPDGFRFRLLKGAAEAAFAKSSLPKGPHRLVFEIAEEGRVVQTFPESLVLRIDPDEKLLKAWFV